MHTRRIYAPPQARGFSFSWSPENVKLERFTGDFIIAVAQNMEKIGRARELKIEDRQDAQYLVFERRTLPAKMNIRRKKATKTARQKSPPTKRHKQADSE
jgi:hypothetical protein